VEDFASRSAPDLNFGLGLRLASYRDMDAVNGSLPTFPDPNSVQSVRVRCCLFSGLEWDGMLGDGPLAEQFTSDFNPALNAVPEPATVLLLGARLAGLAVRRRRQLEGGASC
jgi:hypothetical protein